MTTTTEHAATDTAMYATRYGVTDEVYGYRVVAAAGMKDLIQTLTETIRTEAAESGIDYFALDVDITQPFWPPRTVTIASR